MSTIKNRIGNNIREIRNANNISQHTLASIIKCSQSYLSRIENGTINISVNMVERIANALKIQEEELVRDTK